MPLVLAEQGTERADGAGVRGDCVEGTEVHHVNRLNDRQVRTRQIIVQTIADGRGENLGPLLLRRICYAAIVTFLKVGADLMVQRVVQAQVLGDFQDVVRVRCILPRPGAPVELPRCVVALRPVARRLDHTSLARGAKERSVF